ncbi:hypothetical protein AB1A65_16070 [Muricauda sp. ANG21]|uniref:hypothetical protein n=1 Tax=Allomuricauda sp. ANG21 TaxID=3042468 RepID=UPI003455C237
MNELRWSPNVLIKDDAVDSFWKEHFREEGRRLLFVLGKGFDVRMNFALSRLLDSCPGINLECLLIEFDEGAGSSSLNYNSFVTDNITEYEKIMQGRTTHLKKIKMKNKSGKRGRIVGDRNAADLIKSHSEIEDFTDIIVDISSLPRGLYFSLIGKILKLVDQKQEDQQNLFLTVAENVKIDSLIQENEIEEDLTYLHGFGGQIELEAEKEQPLIWFPILGEEKIAHISKGADKIMEDKARLYEICPVLPFPSKDPRRSDALLIEYHKLLFDSLDIEPQNIMYTTERDPFQTYIQLSDAIANYRESLNVLNGCKIALSTFSSKLISIGTLLVAYEKSEFVGILNVNSGGYDILDESKIKNLKQESELFVTWLTGSPYHQQSPKNSN